MENKSLSPRAIPFGSHQAKERLMRESGARTKLCDVCGQTFDTSDQDEVFHHGPEPHAPSGGRPG